MLSKKMITLIGAALLALGMAATPALARGGGGGFHGGGHMGGGFHGGGFHDGFGGGHFGGFHGGGFHGGFAHRGFGHRPFFAGGFGYGFYDPYFSGWPYAYDDDSYDGCYARLVRVHGHWVRRTVCG